MAPSPHAACSDLERMGNCDRLAFDDKKSSFLVTTDLILEVALAALLLTEIVY